MTKVHAFQISHVTSGPDWMIQEMGDYGPFNGTVYGHKPKERLDVDATFMAMFNPRPGHWAIVWPHGLITFRTDESFKEDFTYKGGTVYETPLEAIFQKGMCSLESRVERAVDALARKVQRQIDEACNLKRIRALPTGYWYPGGVISRNVIPGLLPAPKGFTQ